MPIYEYECQSCGTRIEALQSFNDPPLETCECGDEGKLKKLISAPAFQFKGDGWYVTDYARKGANGKDESSKAKGAKETDVKGAGAKEAKAAPSSEKSAKKGSSSASAGTSS